MTDDPPSSSRDLVAQALELGAQVERFERRWPPLDEAEPCLSFSWEALERQLVELAPTDLQAELVRRLVARTRTWAGLKPPEMVLREVLRAAVLLIEESGLEIPPGPP